MTTTTTTGTASTREYKGAVVPTAGVYDVDQAHTTVEFIARHLMITKVRGRFNTFSGTVTVAEVPEESSVDVTIDASSVHTSQDRPRCSPSERRLLRSRQVPDPDLQEHLGGARR